MRYARESKRNQKVMQFGGLRNFVFPLRLRLFEISEDLLHSQRDLVINKSKILYSWWIKINEF